MGRIFEKRKVRMFARWAKNARTFTKLGKEIAIAVKLGGPNSDINPRLRSAMSTARAMNMPKDRIEAAVQRAVAKDSANIEEITYEGYGPHGVAIFVEAATDNSTRTVANVRSVFNRYGGSLGTTGSLNFLFERKAVFSIAQPESDIDDFELEAIDHGLEDIFETEEGLMLHCGFEDFGAMQKFLEDKKVDIKSAGMQRLATTSVTVTEEQEAEVNKLIEGLEEDDDVQHVYSTMSTESKE